MESQTTIEKPSLGLRNTSKGLSAESVAKQYFLREKFKFLFQRKKLKFGEIDLIFQKGKNIYLVEVKSLHDEWMAFERLGWKQKERLLKNLIYFQSQNRQFKVYCYLCFVKSDQSVSLIDLAD